MEHHKKSRLVLFPFPFQGHINPMIQLASILHNKGFDVSIIHTRFNCPNISKYPHFTFHLIQDGLPEKESDIILLIKLLNESCIQPFTECLARLLYDHKNHSVSCLITDAIWYFSQAVADNLNLPRIVLRTTSVCSFLAFATLPLLQEKGYLNQKDSKPDAPVEELPPLKVMDIPAIETGVPGGAYKMLSTMVEATKKSSGLIFNTFRELEEREISKLGETFLMPTFVIGPFHKCFSASTTSLMTQDRSSILWLDTQAPKSVFYVSFGSLAAMDRDKMNEVAWGLANSRVPFLWVVRPGLVHGSESVVELPDEFLEAVKERGCIVKWAPQQEVLAHPAIGAFWTHSGWNSTIESICEGVPMICTSFFGDQMVNSRYVQDIWKVGIKLEKGLEKGEIERAIRRVLAEKEGEEMRKTVKCLKEKIELCLSSGGSSYQSLDNLVDFIISLTPSSPI